MNWEAIGAIGEIIGAVVVMATLIYLAIQMRQNNTLLRSESRKALLTNDQASLLVALENTDIFKKMTSVDKLSFEDQLRLSWIYIIDMRNREFEYFQYCNGVLDEESWRSFREIIIINHSTQRGRRWWVNVGREIFDSEFVKGVDELLAKHTIDNGSMDLLGAWDNED